MQVGYEAGKSFCNLPLKVVEDNLQLLDRGSTSSRVQRQRSRSQIRPSLGLPEETDRRSPDYTFGRRNIDDNEPLVRISSSTSTEAAATRRDVVMMDLPIVNPREDMMQLPQAAPTVENPLVASRFQGHLDDDDPPALTTEYGQPASLLTFAATTQFGNKVTTLGTNLTDPAPTSTVKPPEDMTLKDLQTFPDDAAETTTLITNDDTSTPNDIETDAETEENEWQEMISSSPRSEATVDLGLLGKFLLLQSRPEKSETGDSRTTERPSPVFRIQDYTDRYPV